VIIAQDQVAANDLEKASSYLIEDGLLSQDEISKMVRERGTESVITYALEHGWQATGEEKPMDFMVDVEAVASLDIDALSAPPTQEEIASVWESFPKKFTADRFEFHGDGIELSEDVLGLNFSHFSEDIQIFGYLYRPIQDGVYPLIVFNHGGFGIGPMRPPKTPSGEGTGKPFSQWCVDLAKEGYVVMASSYRGTKTDAGLSDGSFEGAKGEVTDVLNMVECAKKLSFIDQSRIGMMGTSHGGWITAFAVQRTKEIAAAISFFPPGDIYFSKNGPYGGVGPRMESIVKGRFKGGGAVAILDRAVLVPLVQGKATLAETRAEMISRTIYPFAEHTNSPVYFICGEEDHLCPDVVILYESLKALGKETWYKGYPGEGHGFTFGGSKAAIEGSYNDVVGFFGERLK
jgi:dipeptidyl aminopeptidase/acylaminoacyl peptidase